MIALRAARSLLGLSQEELADVAGVSRQIVVRIEKA
ncbi:helix-turn-helix transcriptional regulator [Rhizobium leguminosarum]|nr:helix-turn-helix domain-containing protein [Rhizobium leguminosarum]RWX20999.1 helix-turn-helix domain-containing protein [Rhizobium leguminosarum]RWX23634.1 helix-turn-helix domain-containing protein [Rhizobium leguminosarum]